MDVVTAVSVIEGLVYKEGWTFTATDRTDRFEGGVCVHVSFPACKSEVPGECVLVDLSPGFIIQVTHEDGPDDVCRKVLDLIADVEDHERREALRYGHNGRAPFHPHTIEGMRLFGAVSHDLTFGTGS